MKTYLMWIGAKHYPTFNAFAEECDTLGLSKRMPTVGMALALKDATVFLAHDEGERINCQACWDEALGRGTGGWAWFRIGHRKKFTYREYLSLKRRGEVDEGVKIKIERCETCGGLGQLPHGRVFGFFVASGVEYVLNREDSNWVRRKMKRDGIKTITMKQTCSEPKRGCGYRQPGGTYLVTGPADEEDEDRMDEIVKELSQQGLIDPKQVFIQGRLASFDLPIEIPGEKRFRGAKRWEPPKAVQAETTMTELAKKGVD